MGLFGFRRPKTIRKAAFLRLFVLTLAARNLITQFGISLNLKKGSLKQKRIDISRYQALLISAVMPIHQSLREALDGPKAFDDAFTKVCYNFYVTKSTGIHQTNL